MRYIHPIKFSCIMYVRIHPLLYSGFHIFVCHFSSLIRSTNRSGDWFTHSCGRVTLLTLLVPFITYPQWNRNRRTSYKMCLALQRPILVLPPVQLSLSRSSVYSAVRAPLMKKWVCTTDRLILALC